MDSQIENAINLAFDPYTQQDLKIQAYDFLNRLREDPNSWQQCLSLFTRQPPTSEVVRVVCLEIVNSAVQTQRMGQGSLNDVRFQLMDYVKSRYASGSIDVDPPGIQNKVTQTITYLFTSLYSSDWPDFFDEFFTIVGFDAGGNVNHPVAAAMFLRLLRSIHDEIADLMIPRSREEQQRNNDLKDLIRARDVNKIAVMWQDILSRWRQLDLSLVELCLQTIGKWVSWIDIALVINERIQSALLEIAGQQGSLSSESKEAKARDAAIGTFTETVGKKMSDIAKIELIKYLNLQTIVGQLIGSPALSEMRTTAEYDTDMAEAVAKLVNNVAVDVVRILDGEGLEAQTRTAADEQLQIFVPYILRFFSDEYDEICSAVIQCLGDLLNMFRKTVKAKGSLPSHYSSMLPTILDTIVAKMKYDETASWDEEGEGTDEAEFQELRKKLHVLQQTVAAADESLYMNTLSGVIANTLNRLASPSDRPNWRDLDLALLEMHHFGELAIKNGGLYTKSKPTSEASSRLMEMMSLVVDSGLANYPHPAIQLQYMEICVRYVQFFEQNLSAIPKVLESFVSFVHSDHQKVRLRSWYLIYRLTKHLRSQMSGYAQEVVQAISDCLVIHAELPADRDDDDASSEDNGQSTDAVFQSQLYLFEAIGAVSSTNQVSSSTKVAIAKSIIEPLVNDLSSHLPTASTGDPRAVLQVHHIIMAMGSLAGGFSDYTPGASSGANHTASEVSTEFVGASESILVALENLREQSDVRTAARHAFSRLLGVLGSQILPQLPRWIEGLLSSASTNDEMAMFLRTLGQVIYGFKTEIYNILDQLLSPLLQRVYAGLSQATTGTDDEVQMRELKSQYLNLILVIINNDLGAVLVSPANQGSFDSFITSITKFACDPSDPPSARAAFSVLTKLTSMWGGPDLVADAGSNTTPQPVLAGFDSFILSQFAPLPWSLVSAPGFNPSDAQMRSVLQEAAVLQWTILRKSGIAYQNQLQNELHNLGAGDDSVRSYISSIGQEQAGFKKFFTMFVQQAKQ